MKTKIITNSVLAVTMGFGLIAMTGQASAEAVFPPSHLHPDAECNETNNQSMFDSHRIPWYMQGPGSDRERISINESYRIESGPRDGTTPWYFDGV